MIYFFIVGEIFHVDLTIGGFGHSTSNSNLGLFAAKVQLASASASVDIIKQVNIDDDMIDITQTIVLPLRDESFGSHESSCRLYVCVYGMYVRPTHEATWVLYFVSSFAPELLAAQACRVAIATCHQWLTRLPCCMRHRGRES